MCQLVANDAVVTLAERGQCQRIGGSTVEYEIDIAIGSKQVTQALGSLSCPFVIALGRGVTDIGLNRS